MTVFVDYDVPETATLLHAGLQPSDEPRIQEHGRAAFGTHALPIGQIDLGNGIEDSAPIGHASPSLAKQYGPECPMLLTVAQWSISLCIGLGRRCVCGD